MHGRAAVSSGQITKQCTLRWIGQRCTPHALGAAWRSFNSWWDSAQTQHRTLQQIQLLYYEGGYYDGESWSRRNIPAVSDGPSAFHLAFARGHLGVVEYLHETVGSNAHRRVDAASKMSKEPIINKPVKKKRDKSCKKRQTNFNQTASHFTSSTNFATTKIPLSYT